MPGNLGVSLSRACEKFGHAVALSNGTDSLSYTELMRQARAVTEQLVAAGISANEPVHVRVSNHPLDLVALLGVWNANGVAVPLHRSTPQESELRINAKTQARLVVDMKPAHGTSDPVVTNKGTLPPPARPVLEGAALIIFTSGSTGTPKGVVVSHAAFNGKIEQIDSLLHFQQSERIMLVLNITFSFGMWLSLLTLLRGGTLVMKEKFEPVQFMTALREERISRVGMVPTMMRVLFANPQMLTQIDALAHQRTLHQIVIGGEALGTSLATDIRRRFAGTQLVDIYGLTETATCDFFSFPADYEMYPGCIGRAAPHVEFRIVNAYGEVMADGSIGELQIKSPYLMAGYLDDAELTAAAFADGWFITGDLCRLVDGEVVELMGRSKEIISRGGNKVTPGEIEQLLCAHADIAGAMAVGVADAILGERIHALIVPRSGATIEIASLKAFLESKLEKFKQPDVYYVSSELPLGMTGKADRKRFKTMIESGAVSAVGH